jgi:hypothetical protein
MQHTTETPRQYQCRHIFTDGHRCASPCLRKEEFCYYTTPPENPSPIRNNAAAAAPPSTCLYRKTIQASIGEVLHRIASNEIDPVAPASSSTASRLPALIN